MYLINFNLSPLLIVQINPFSSNVLCFNIAMENIGDPDSPLSTNSLIFDGENFVLPLDQDYMDQTNFCPPRASSQLPSSKYFAIN